VGNLLFGWCCVATVMRRGIEPDRLRSNLRLSSAGQSPIARQQMNAMATRLAPEIGRFFRDLRQIFRLSREQIAQKLATRPDIISALEAGDVRVLPPWPETCRIVRTYAGIARLDPRPVLHSMETLIAYDRHLMGTMPQSMLARLGRCSASALAAFGHFRASPFAAGSLFWNRITRGHRGTSRALVLIAFPIAIIVLLTQTAVLEAGVSQLPEPVARMVRGAQDYVTLQLAPTRNGLRWVDVADPRTRRGDKLKTAGQPD